MSAIAPAFFKIALKNKYSYGADSAEMLHIVGRTIILDFSYILGLRRLCLDSDEDGKTGFQR